MKKTVVCAILFLAFLAAGFALAAEQMELKLLSAEVTILQERAARLEAQYHLVMRDLKEKQQQLQVMQAWEKATKEKTKAESHKK